MNITNGKLDFEKMFKFSLGIYNLLENSKMIFKKCD